MGTRGRTFVIALFTALAVALGAPLTAVAVVADVVTVAHRAGAGNAPEQTAAAFETAVKARPDHIEVDVQLSADDVPVLVHDKTLARTTDVGEVFPERVGDPVGSFTYAEIRNLDAGSWFDERFAGERIPRLASVPDHLDGTGIGLFLELKNPAGSPGLERVVDEVIDADSRWESIDVTFLSFEAVSLKRIAKLRPEARLLWINPDVPGSKRLDKVGEWADELGVNHRRMTERDTRRVHAADLRLAVYTVNSERAMRWALSVGVDTLITDYPEKVAKL